MYRESLVFFTLIIVLFAISVFCIIDAKYRIKNENENKVKIIMARKYYLTDLAIFSDASYLRHITQSDFFAPFQDNPVSFDIFPTSSLVKPPHLIF